MKQLSIAIFLLSTFIANAQNTIKWPEGKKALIVLTYDDALASQLDIAIPQLDNAQLKGTFFLNEPATEQHISRWRTAGQNGHELGNHTIYHPCHSSKISTDPHYHSENYNVNTILREILGMNKMLYAVDNKTKHTFAYPCCETSVGGENYVEALRNSGYVTYARSCGAYPVVTDFKNLDPFEVPSKFFNTNPPASELIDFVKQVRESNGMGVIIFHGVGGDYLEVSSEAHQELINYLKDNSKDIWVTTFGEAMDYVMKKSR